MKIALQVNVPDSFRISIGRAINGGIAIIATQHETKDFLTCVLNDTILHITNEELQKNANLYIKRVKNKMAAKEQLIKVSKRIKINDDIPPLFPDVNKKDA